MTNKRFMLFLIPFSLILWFMPVGSDKKPVEGIKETVCDKCGEAHCIYWEGEKIGLNEYQVETFLFTLQKIIK